MALRITLAVIVVLAVGAGVFAAVTYWQHVRHDDACSVYANALTAAVAQPGVRPDRRVMDLLTAQDVKEVITSDNTHNAEVSQANADENTSLIGTLNQLWDQFETQIQG